MKARTRRKKESARRRGTTALELMEWLREIPEYQLKKMKIELRIGMAKANLVAMVLDPDETKVSLVYR